VKSSLILFFAGICISLAAQTSSAQTVAVGNCRPHRVSYSTISAAVAAVPPNSTVLVCPGTYPEQVVITQALTLRGLNLGTGSNPVITVPSGGLALNGEQAAQIFVQGTDSPAFGPVNISNLVVDGTRSGFNCSIGSLVGIAYEFASGSLENVNVRRQNPGRCGFGISLTGSPFEVNTVNVLNSSITDFDDTGIRGLSDGATGFFVNLTSNWVASASASVYAGVDYEMTDGLAARNTILLSGGDGLLLNNFFAGMTAKHNTIIGASVGILAGGSLPFEPTIITHNSLFNNATGILISAFNGNSIVNSNAISESSTAAIDLDCSPDTTAEHNEIFGAPIGIANISSGDTVTGNIFYSVTTATTTCP